FLGSALTTAAGVAGGLVVGNALMDMFSPHRAAASELGGGFMPAAPVESSPWGAPAGGGDPGYVDQGSWTTPDSGTDQGGGYADQGSWDAGGGGDQASWDSSGGDDGGWDDN